MKRLLLTAALLPMLAATAQKREETFNNRFQPTKVGGRYRVTTEKQDTLWHRTALYLPEATPAMEGWYRDQGCKVPHGVEIWYHPDGGLKSKGAYVNGKKQDTWLAYDRKGRLRDSATYADGKLRGTRLQWHDNGRLSDSTEFDWAGNGVQVSWYRDGAVASAGLWVSDTLRRGRWQYYHPNGELLAIEEYKDGKLTGSACFDSTGKRLEKCEQKEATFAGGPEAWRKYLERNLKATVPVDNGAKPGTYTVVVQFMVNTDGSIEDIKPMTKHGYGMEEEVVRIIEKGPRWIPARKYGQVMKAYRYQPVTFVVSNGAPSRRDKDIMSDFPPPTSWEQ